MWEVEGGEGGVEVGDGGGVEDGGEGDWVVDWWCYWGWGCLGWGC